MGRAGRKGAAVVAGLGLILFTVFALSENQTVAAACMGLAALCSMGGTIAGPLLNKPPSARPWWLVTGAATLFLVGVLVRPWASVQEGPAVGAADLFTLSGYGLLIAATASILRSGGRRLEPHAVTDGVIVCLGVGAVSTVLFSLPAAAILDRPVAISMIAGLYPLLDVVLLLLLLNLAFTMPGGLPSFMSFSVAMVMIFVGDIGYAWIGARGKLTGSHLLDLPFILAYLGFGYAALHPSMVQMANAVPRLVQPWSARRLALIVPALAAPAAVLAGPVELNGASRAVIAVATCGMVVAMLVRSVRAVRDYARVQEVFRHRATHDALTDLPNRVLLAERLEVALADSRRRHPVTLLYLDLDGFKLVNDSWGHETGDRLLVEVAHRLRAVAGTQVTVARTGGDEFALAGRLTAADAAVLAERVLAALREPLEVDGLDLVVTASVGLAEATGRTTAEGMLRDADTAMYRSKSEGRDRWVVFDQAMQQSVRDRVEIELALRQAMSRDQLWIAYQPIVDLGTERVIGAEALLRWSHPVRGLMPPLEFIPVAEETGMIADIGAWVLCESLRQVAAWRAAGIVGEDFVISVNASTRQLRDDRLLEVARQALAETGLPARTLIVEITESVMLEQSQAAVDALLGLRSLGVSLSVDDFGTGYSSLGYLSRYPVTGVKVDRAFVERLGGDVGDEVIVRAISAMAGALRLGVVAEGVETAQQRDILRAIGVQHGQGWLWGRAVDSAGFVAAHGLMAQAGVGNSYAQ